jgi:hypothetical protein
LTNITASFLLCGSNSGSSIFVADSHPGGFLKANPIVE